MTCIVGVLISTVQNPISFDNFTANDTSSGADQFARNYASGSGEGTVCIPLDLSNTGVSGVQSGANVTIQIVYDGGDGNLFQVSALVLPIAFLTYVPTSLRLHVISSFLLYTLLSSTVCRLDPREQYHHAVERHLL